MPRQVLSAVILLTITAMALAHHSFAMFDMQQQRSIKGQIKEFQWTNPHIWIHVEVRDESGTAIEWYIEGSSPVLLARRGWKPALIKPGDTVSMVINPLKDGRAGGGSFVSMILADGTAVGPQGVQPASAAAGSK